MRINPGRVTSRFQSETGSRAGGRSVSHCSTGAGYSCFHSTFHFVLSGSVPGTATHIGVRKQLRGSVQAGTAALRHKENRPVV